MANPFAEIDTFAQGNKQWQPRGSGFSGGNYNSGGQGWRQNQFGRQNRGDGPQMKRKVVFFEDKVCDMSADQWDTSGERVPFSQRGQNGTDPVELICVAFNLRGVKEAVKMQRVVPLVVKASDDFGTSVRRAHELQQWLSLDMDDSEWADFIARIRGLNLDCDANVVSVKKYLGKNNNVKRTDTAADVKTFLEAFQKFANASPACSTFVKPDDEMPDDGGDGEQFVGHSDGKVESPTGNIHVQEFRKFMQDPAKRDLMADFMKNMNGKSEMPPPAKPFSGARGSGTTAAAPLPVHEVDMSTPRGAKSGGNSMDTSGNPAAKKKGKGQQEVS